jgi:outer membrane protein TolC
VTTELARAFVARATLRARIALSDRSIAQALELQRIVELRRREGVATDVDVGLQVIRIGELRIERDRVQESFDQTRVAIALLVGAEAPGFRSIPAEIHYFVVGSVALPAPSALASSRPDVQAAEARIQAAGGDVAQARAAFFPRLDLSVGRGATLLTAGPLSGLTIGADLLAPIFARNRLKGNLAAAAAAQRESVQTYRAALVGALAEAENALSAAAHARTRGNILAKLDVQMERTVDLARSQYLAGEADLRHLIDAQDYLIAAKDAQLVNLQEQLDAAILLYKVSCNRPSSAAA